MDWFLYDSDLRPERVKSIYHQNKSESLGASPIKSPIGKNTYLKV